MLNTSISPNGSRMFLFHPGGQMADGFDLIDFRDLSNQSSLYCSNKNKNQKKLNKGALGEDLCLWPVGHLRCRELPKQVGEGAY